MLNKSKTQAEPKKNDVPSTFPKIGEVPQQFSSKEEGKKEKEGPIKVPFGQNLSKPLDTGD